MAAYVPVLTEPFKKCVQSFDPQRRERVKRLVLRVLQNPCGPPSHKLKRKKVDLRGKRARPDEAGRYVVIYMVCQECVAHGYREAGYNNCDRCEDIPQNAVVFLAFGPHDDTYERYWQQVIAADQAE
jgi:mRNA-degrading endonuclease RelE of RelBE toxin-antitoxin system